MLSTAYMIKKYGMPNQTGTYLVSIKLPYPMRIAWDLKTKVTTMRCHKLIADRLISVFNDLLSYYGYDELVRLGIDLFGGCFNYRQMRGGTSWSFHAFGCAVDLDPERNGLNTPFAKAQFSKPEYKKLHEIFEKYDFINLGKTENRDSMHFQINI